MFCFSQFTKRSMLFFGLGHIMLEFISLMEEYLISSKHKIKITKLHIVYEKHS